MTALYFWGVLGAMTLIALGFVVLPVWRAKTAPGEKRRAVNVAIYRERKNALQQDLAQSTIDHAQAGAEQAELDRRLLQDVSPEGLSASHSASSRSRLLTATALTVLLPIAAIALYLKTGDWRLSIAGGGVEATEILVQRLADRMREHPENTEGWLFLGRGYTELRQFPEAADAYAEFNRRGTPTAESLISEAEVRALLAGGSLAGRPLELVNHALQLQPDMGRALWYQGLASLQSGDKTGAEGSWERLSRQELPEDFRAVLDRHLALVRGLPPDSVHTKAITVAGVRIPVQVAIDPELANRVSPDAAVFIYAKAEQGPPMPLAVVRKTVRDLPASFELNDGMAMMAEHKLSKYDRWVITARIALNGSAEARSGDLFDEQRLGRGELPKTVHLLINRAMP